MTQVTSTLTLTAEQIKSVKETKNWTPSRVVWAEINEFSELAIHANKNRAQLNKAIKAGVAVYIQE